MSPGHVIDLAIIGGGPAGTSAALAARRRGLEVAIWERDKFPRDKVCGEFLSAESLPLLRQEIPGVLRRGVTITRPEFISARGRVYTFALPEPACGLSRRVLDEALWHAAETAGARVQQGCAVWALRKVKLSCDDAECCSGPSGGSAWELESLGGSTQRAKSLIVACGRWWALEGIPSPARRERWEAVSPWVGVKAHFSGVAVRDAVEMYFFPGGYCGLAPIEDGLYDACCLVHRRLVRELGAGGPSDLAAWMRAVARHPVLDSRLRGAVQASETTTTAPVCLSRRSAEHHGALIAGDAAGFLDPFTGDGISMALHSGRLAAEQVARVHERGRTAGRPAPRYGRSLGRAVRRSYWVAGLVRLLVCAPARVQESAVSVVVPWLGRRLLAATRWRYDVNPTALC